MADVDYAWFRSWTDELVGRQLHIQFPVPLASKVYLYRAALTGRFHDSLLRVDQLIVLGCDDVVGNIHSHSISCSGKLRVCQQHFPDVSCLLSSEAGSLKP